MRNNIINAPDECIEEAITEEKIWLEAITLNILPGEEIVFKLSEKDAKKLQPGQDNVQLSAIVDEEGKARVLIQSNQNI